VQLQRDGTPEQLIVTWFTRDDWRMDKDRVLVQI
jgi:hypothetical protein